MEEQGPKSPLLEGLNPEQKQAVLQTEGPVLVLAGAGSGKTKALTHRIAYLIREKKVSPFNILAVTFTNKAAAEMSTRVGTLLIQKSEVKSQKGGSGDPEEIAPLGTSRNNQQFNNATIQQSASIRLPWLGTFHSICVRILRREIEHLGFSSNFTIYDSSDQKSVVKRCMRELDIDTKNFNPSAVQHFISGAKNELIDEKEYKRYVNSPMEKVVSDVYAKYQAYLRQSNALDFDDLIMKTVELFQANPDVLEKYQNQYKYILIDEYQDTNQAQYVWVKLLAKKHKNIMVVGDDYQAIYGWRGANFRNILNFERDWPGSQVIKLEQNYRSTDTILTAANEVIKFNKNKTDKTLWTEAGSGCPITIYQALNERDEAEFCALEIGSRVQIESRESKTERDYTKYAVLYRTNAQSRALEEAFMRMNIPYKVIGGVRFYERKEVKDIVSYLRLIVNPADFESWERASGSPSRGLGEKTLAKIRELSYDQIRDPNQFPDDRAPKKLTDFLAMMSEIRKTAEDMNLDDLIIHVAVKSGYKNYLLDGTAEGEGRWENVQELATVASQPMEINGDDLRGANGRSFYELEQFLERVALIQDTDNLAAGSNAVTLMTLHSAKGLEFDTVFITGMEEGVFPHSRSIMDQSEMEEERRLCYVGITRARKRLYLIYTFERNLYGRFQSNPESRFISHIPEGLVDRI